MDRRVKPGDDTACVESVIVRFIIMMMIAYAIAVVVIVLVIAMMMVVRTVAMMVMAVPVSFVPRLLLLLFLRLPVMRRMLVVLPQQIKAVVVAVRRAHDGVDVELGRLRIGQEHAGMVIEFDEHDRTLDPIVEGARVVTTTDPAEMRIP